MTPRCSVCLGYQWTCEQHTTKPWAGVAGDSDGCEPDCAGPGEPCPEGCWDGTNDDLIVHDCSGMSNSSIVSAILKRFSELSES